MDSSPSPTRTTDAPLSQSQETLLEDVRHTAMLSDQFNDRLKLKELAKDFVEIIGSNIDSLAVDGWDIKKADAERSLSLIWPPEKTISELTSQVDRPQYMGMKAFHVTSEHGSRNAPLKEGAFPIFGRISSESTNEMTKDFFAVVTPRVAISLTVNYGDYCDDSYDAYLFATIVLVEDPSKMQDYIRKSMDRMDWTNDLEERLKTVFASNYKPPAPFAQPVSSVSGDLDEGAQPPLLVRKAFKP